MYQNPLLNNSIYDSPSKSQSNNYSNIIYYDDEIYFNSNKTATQRQNKQFITHTPFLTNNSSHFSTISYRDYKQHSKQTNTLHSNMFHIPPQRKTKSKIDKTVFTQKTEQLFHNIKNDNQNLKFNYYDFINDDNFIPSHNKTLSNNSNKEIIKQFIARSCSKQKKIISCSRNRHYSFVNICTKSKPVHTNCNSNRSPEEFYTEQKMFLEKKEDNVTHLRNRIHMNEKKLLRDKPILTSNTVNIAMKKQKCKNVHIRLYKNKALIGNIFSKAFDISLSENKSSRTSRLISNSVYLRLTSRNNSKQQNSSLQKKQKHLSKLTSNESLGILLDKFLTSFELFLINICNLTMQNVSNGTTVSREQLLEILLQLHFINNSNDVQLFENVWNDLIIKTTEQIQTQEISLLNLLMFLLSVLGLINNDNQSGIPSYMNQRLNGLINVNKINEFQSKGKSISQINVQYQEMRNNYFNYNFYISKESTSMNTPEHIVQKPKTKEKNLSLYDSYKNSKFAKEKILKEEKEKEIKKELSQCTFKPDLSLTNKQNSSLNNQTRSSITSRLYTDVTNKMKQKVASNHKLIQTNNETNLRKYPKTPTPLNMQMFTINPLQSDRTVQEKYEKLKQTREEQKKKQFYFTRGEPLSSRFSNRNSFINCYKESLFLNSDFEIAIDVTKGKNYKKSKEKDCNVKKILIKKGEDAFMKINDFCKRNGLDKESQMQIISSIKNKINGVI